MLLLKTHSQKRLLAFALALVISLSFSVFTQNSEGLREIENRTWDWRVRLVVGKGGADSRIKIIEVDQNSLDNQAREGFTWPWPRSRYQPIIKYLELAGARGLAFDVLFTEASSYGAEDDRQFAEALRSKLPILNVLSLSTSEREVDDDRFAQFAQRLHESDQRSNYSTWLKQFPLNEYSSVQLPIAEILMNTSGLGNVSAEPDSDGVFRHYKIAGGIWDVNVLNSPFAFFEMIEGKELNKIDIRKFIDDQGRLAVRFHEPDGAYDPISADAVLQSYFQIQRNEKPLVDPQKYKDAWVYFGLTAPGLFDLKPTPLNDKGKAVEYLATVLDNIIHQDFVVKLNFSKNLIIAALLIIWICLAVFYIAAPAKQLNITLAFLSLLLISFVSAKSGYWISFTTPFAGSIVALILSLALQYSLEGQQHRFIREAFRHYVSPSVIEKIIKDPSYLSLGGEKRELTMFFSDIIGFTSISEKLEANKLVALMNRFLSEMTGIIQGHNGTVDKYVGDAIVAFWNAPLPIAEHAKLAVAAALKCQERLKQLSSEFKREFGVEIAMRIGINTGIVSVGNFGSKERFSYTMLGDAANLASRLEGANKQFGTEILISEETNNALSGAFTTRKIANIQVVGKDKAVLVYQPLPAFNGLIAENIEVFTQAMQAFEAGRLKDSLQYFRSIPQDSVAGKYVSRIESELSKGQDTNWSPVWKLVEK